MLLSLPQISCALKVMFQTPCCHRIKLLSISKCLGQTQSWQNFGFIREVTPQVNMANFCSPLLRILHLSHGFGLTLIAVVSWYSWPLFLFVQPPARRKGDRICKVAMTFHAVTELARAKCLGYPGTELHNRNCCGWVKHPILLSGKGL